MKTSVAGASQNLKYIFVGLRDLPFKDVIDIKDQTQSLQGKKLLHEFESHASPLHENPLLSIFQVCIPASYAAHVYGV